MENWIAYILEVTGASDIESKESVQELWSGYGHIYRLILSNSNYPSVIVKWIQPPDIERHPRGWNTSFGNLRKLKSYEVEANWYAGYNAFQHPQLKYPIIYGLRKKDKVQLLVLEDLTCTGFHTKETELTDDEIASVLKWLAGFHATFLGETPHKLWEVGTYWHLETRPEELARMKDLHLKEVASEVDRILNECRFKTIVHGDAKQANFAFHDNGEVAAFDFQYTGGGSGIKDVVYFMSSCLTSSQMIRKEDELLDTYFEELKKKLHSKMNSDELNELESEWRKLYCYAWTDFARFLNGWSPGHYKMNEYVQQQIRKAIG